MRTTIDYGAAGQETLVRMKREILTDIASGRVPDTVLTFGELHDYVDANEYGGACESDEDAHGWWDGDEEQRQASMLYWDWAQCQIDAWLKAGRP
jgi:hypothetical protein